MIERRLLVAANWKMHGQKLQNETLLQALLSGLVKISAPEIVICPPSIYLAQLQSELQNTILTLGAQNIFTEEKGAYTGEISAPMLIDFGCRYVIVGHSERRCLFGEDDNLVADKFIAAQKAGLIPILCVGESREQREGGLTDEVVSAQVGKVLKKVGVQAFRGAVVAYEPVWAIGTGITATPDEAQVVHKSIRTMIASHDAVVASKLRIIYGGSVNAFNAWDLIAKSDIDGALVGGASLVADQFISICKSMSGNKNA
ncbi:MAG: triose-phosphate isomerase [Pseudomonadota bacterium]